MPFERPHLFPGDLLDSALRFGASFGNSFGTSFGAALPESLDAKPKARGNASGSIPGGAPSASVPAGGDPKGPTAIALRGVRQMRELGWPLVLLPEAGGGVGGGIREAAALAEGLAAQAVALPLFELCVALPRLLALAADDHWLERWQHPDRLWMPVADGLRYTDPRMAVTVRAEHDGAAYRLSGCAPAVALGAEASDFLVACPVGDDAGAALGLFHVEADAQGVSRSRQWRVDGGLAGNVRFDKVAAAVPLALCEPRALAATLASIQAAGCLLSTVEQVAAMGAMVAETISYLIQRQQFGKPLSLLQALRHRVADMYVKFEVAKAAVQAAVEEATAEEAAEGGAFQRLDMLKVCTGEAARSILQEGIQLHGGMGMTVEAAAGRLAKKLVHLEFESGDRLSHSS